MKKITIILVAVTLTVLSSFAQYSGVVEEVKFEELDKTSQKMFSKYGNINPYGKLLKFDGLDSASIIGVFRITKIPKSKKMVTDTLVTPNVTKPECEDQYMIMYKINNTTGCVVTISDPTADGEDAASIAAFMNDTGLKQGDDEFETDPIYDTSTKVEDDYNIGEEW